MKLQVGTGGSMNEALEAITADPEEYLEALEARFIEQEPQVQAFLPEANRFERLRDELTELGSTYPDPKHRPKLFGLPVGIKDIFHAEGFPTHAGSRIPPESLSGKQATSVSRLKSAGALVLGKTVTTEFAYFAPGPTRNPHNLAHTPGGSSSGSAAAVAAGLAPLALGTQTIGSINRPAAFCGVVGFKPSFGRVSTAGVIPLSPSFDHVGYFTSDVAGALIAASVLLSEWNPAQSNEPLKIGIPTGSYLVGASQIALEHLRAVRSRLERTGVTFVEIAMMPDYRSIIDRHNVILAADAAKVHQQWFDEYGALYHPKTAELIRTGQRVTEEQLQAALEGPSELRREFEDRMAEHRIDAWISPAAPGPAPAGLESTGDPVMNLPWTHSGLPSITLPTGLSADGLPLGTQLTGKWNADERLLGVALNVETTLVSKPQ